MFLLYKNIMTREYYISTTVNREDTFISKHYTLDLAKEAMYKKMGMFKYKFVYLNTGLSTDERWMKPNIVSDINSRLKDAKWIKC